MNWRTLIVEGLRYHARSHLGAFLGAAVGSAVLVGALLVGDSVRGSLREMALERIGSAAVALAAGDRLFREELRDDFHRTWPSSVSADLLVLGTAVTGDHSARANHVQVLGTDREFWKLAIQPPPFANVENDSVVLNEALAWQLHAKKGDVILLRMEKPALLSRDAPLAPEEDASVALRLAVQAIVSDASFGRFALHASQIPPLNAFVRLANLQARLGIGRCANLLLCGAAQTGADGSAVAAAEGALRQSWQLADAELELRSLEQFHQIELRTKRVFLDESIARAAMKLGGTNPSGILTYFVNELRVGRKATPYSMVAAMHGPVVPPEMRDNEILINSWLADDLGAKSGDRLRMTYYGMGNLRRLEERSSDFVVRGIVPMEGAAADPNLMPDFPGMADAKNCRDWDTGFAIDLDKIRDKDNQYWQEHRGTPKAFVTLETGQRLWTNRFGALTAVRFNVSPGASSGQAQQKIERDLRAALDPAMTGLNFQPLREHALAASSQAQDFGGLFIGFSLFLVAAALLLMGLLFQFGMERRAEEVGIFLALGWRPRRVRKLFFWEGGALAVAGAAVGVLGGIAYARVILRALSTIWRAAIGGASLRFHVTSGTLAIGSIASVVVCWSTLWLVLRKQARQPARVLLSEGSLETAWPDAPERAWSFWIGLSTAMLGGGTLAYAWWNEQAATADNFFTAGALLLISGLSFCGVWMRYLGKKISAGPFGVSALGVRNIARRRRRSLATITLLACGSFLIASIGVFRLGTAGAEKRASGTGGFALVGESSIAIVEDLNSRKGKEVFGLDTNITAGTEVVPMRVHGGEDASCLNLNRAQQPRLLGVDPKALESRESFAFVKTAAGLPKEHPWQLLNRRESDPIVPAIGDAASIQWALGKKVGDLVPYVDEHGRRFQVRLVGAVANSILQGSLLISEEAFTSRFPSESGYRMFLIDVPSKQVEPVANELTRALQDWGLELTPAARRLAEFNAVQNTYLSTFQALGGLGLVLGSFGLGVVVLRNVLERRSELGVLLAMGFVPRSVRWLVISEHALLLALGWCVGIAAGIAAVLPEVLSPAAQIPYAGMGLTLAAVVMSGLLWTWIAARWALHGNLLAALRNE